MRVVLVHGIGQEGRGGAIETEWLDALRSTMKGADGWPVPPATEVATAFYGDVLAKVARDRGRVAAIAQGTEEPSDEFAGFAAPALFEMALRMGVERTELDRALASSAVSQGAGPHKRSIKAMARLVERISPFHGDVALRLLAEAHAYLKRPHVAAEIDAMVRPSLAGGGPLIVVAHSLGTVVAYRLLRQLALDGDLVCHLLVTLGSPLGIDAIRRSFSLPRGRPTGVARWLNVADPCDFVALRPVLDGTSFGTGIENIAVNNPSADPHGALGYLAHSEVVDAITKATAT